MIRGAFLKIAAATIAAGSAGAMAAILAPALAQGLPNGKGKEIVQMACLDCHDLSPITSAAYSRTEWDTIVKNMADMGANLKREEIPIVVEYLSASFPPRTKK